MKLFSLFRFFRSLIGRHLSTNKHKHDQNEGCEFLDEPVHMEDEPFSDTELGKY